MFCSKQSSWLLWYCPILLIAETVAVSRRRVLCIYCVKMSGLRLFWGTECVIPFLSLVHVHRVFLHAFLLPAVSEGEQSMPQSCRASAVHIGDVEGDGTGQYTQPRDWGRSLLREVRTVLVTWNSINTCLRVVRASRPCCDWRSRRLA